MFKLAIVLGVSIASIFSLSASSIGGTPLVSQDEGAHQPTDVVVAAALPEAPEEPVPEVPEVLGLRMEPVPAELAAHLGLSGRAGVLVTAVADRSPAKRAGLAPFDVILTIDEAAADVDLVQRALASDAELELEVVRGGVAHRWAVPASGKQSANASLMNLPPMPLPSRPNAQTGSLIRLRCSVTATPREADSAR